jgi:hypothetical protein
MNHIKKFVKGSAKIAVLSYLLHRVILIQYDIVIIQYEIINW